MNEGKGKNIIWVNRTLIWSYIRPYLGLQIETFICTLIVTLLSLPGPFLIQILVDNVLLGGSFQYIWPVIWGLIGLNISSIIFGFLESYIFTYFSGRVLTDLRTSMLEKVLSLHITFFNENKMGNIMTRLTQDISIISDFLTTTVLSLIIDIITVFFVLIILFIQNWLLTILSLLILPVFTLIFTVLNRYVKKIAKELQERHASMNGFLQEVLNNIYVVKAYNLSRYMRRKFFSENSSIIRCSIKNSVTHKTAQSINELTLAVGPILILIFGAKQIIAGTLTIGTLMMFYMMISRLYGPLQRLINMNIRLQVALVH